MLAQEACIPDQVPQTPIALGHTFGGKSEALCRSISVDADRSTTRHVQATYANPGLFRQGASTGFSARSVYSLPINRPIQILPEFRHFPGLLSESPGDNLTLSLAMLDRSKRIAVGTGIDSIYLRHPHTIATGASLIEELHPGRFLLGLGASHLPFHEEMGVTLRKRMSALAGEIWVNAALCYEW
jgi:Luciferase-like monooxygenase